MGVLLALWFRFWLWSLRVQWVGDWAASDEPAGGFVLAFFHGKQFALLRFPRALPMAVMVSHSLDGEIQAGALGHLGFSVVRGSSSRGGMAALAAIIRHLKLGRGPAAFAVDGPKGPYQRAKGGAALAATRAGLKVVPLASASRWKIVFHKAWDRYELALPFSRVCIVRGRPLANPSEQELTAALKELGRQAEQAVGIA